MFKEHYNKYIDLPVIPLKGKVPLIKEWSKYCKELPTADIIDFFIEKFPNANIGLCLGPASNLIAIDIDKDESLSLVPLSPIVKKGAKGETRFFKYNGELPFKRHDIGIELLSNGNQTVMPPSIHPITNQPYIWLRKECDFDDLPTLDPEFLNSINQTQKTNANITLSDGSRCNHGSHSKLSEILIAMLHSNKSPDEIAKRLLEVDEEINDKISYFLCPSRKEWRTNNKIVNAYSFITEGMKRHSEIVKPQVKFEIIEVNEKEKKVDVESYKRIKLPEFRGIAQDIFKHIYNNSPIPRTRFAVASTLACMSTTLANIVHCRNIYSNMYIVITAPSGGGKDFPLSFPAQLFSEAKCKELSGGSPQSDSGILRDLSNRQVRLDVIDEASRLFILMNDTKNAYASKMADVYATLYSSPGKQYSGSVLKNERLGECFSPCVSLFCALTIEDFRKHFNIDLVSKGIGARFLFFPDNEYKDLIEFNPSPIPKNLIDFVGNVRRCIPTTYLDFTKSNSPIEIKIDSNNYKKYISIVNEFRKMGNRDGQQLMGPIYNRLGENMLKLAVMDSVSLERFTITKDSLDWAYSWVKCYINSLDKFLSLNIFGSKSSCVMSELEEYIKTQVCGMTTSQLLRSSICQKYDLQSRALTPYLETLVDSEKIVMEQIPTKGKTKYNYIHIDNIVK